MRAGAAGNAYNALKRSLSALGCSADNEADHVRSFARDLRSDAAQASGRTSVGHSLVTRARKRRRRRQGSRSLVHSRSSFGCGVSSRDGPRSAVRLTLANLVRMRRRRRSASNRTSFGHSLAILVRMRRRRRIGPRSAVRTRSSFGCGTTKHDLVRSYTRDPRPGAARTPNN